MELLELEHNTRVEELKEEISEIGDETIQQMIISEKVCNGCCVCRLHID